MKSDDLMKKWAYLSYCIAGINRFCAANEQR